MAQAPAWTPSDTITVTSVGVAAWAGLFGAWLGARWTRKSQDDARKAAERFTRQQDALSVIGPVMALLVDVHPDRLALYASPEMMEVVRKAWGRWTDTLRDRTMALAAGHPDADVREAASLLAVKMHNAVTIGTMVVRDVLAHQLERSLEDAKREHAEATAACDRLAELIR